MIEGHDFEREPLSCVFVAFALDDRTSCTRCYRLGLSWRLLLDSWRSNDVTEFRPRKGSELVSPLGMLELHRYQGIDP